MLTEQEILECAKTEKQIAIEALNRLFNTPNMCGNTDIDLVVEKIINAAILSIAAVHSSAGNIVSSKDA